ncbi:NADP-dependent oxidoreductase [Actinomycetospora lutea]|nr:NADP-dependent oxidoreductase [Actinomycetospora lutea]MDD7942030.1 NADP-dependent oxidoreductase [Actinomycetospora lutea]
MAVDEPRDLVGVTADAQAIDNVRLLLAARPTGLPGQECWARSVEAVPELDDGQFRVRVQYIGLEPAMRGWMNERPSYIPPVGLNEVMRAFCAGTVAVSRNDAFPPGTPVTGEFGVQEYAVSDGAGVTVADTAVADMPTWLGALGLTGMTAYFGLFEVGALRDGDTVVVSGAAGAVGTVVGQLAKIRGCRVVGIAGRPEKCRWLVDDLGLDAAIDYRREDVRRGLIAAAPHGVDVYFDNVGGPILDAVLARLRRRARVVLCGAISQYNAEGGVSGPAHYTSLLVNRARMEGFIVFDYADRYSEAATVMAEWLRDGRLRSEHEIVRGTVDDFPELRGHQPEIGPDRGAGEAVPVGDLDAQPGRGQRRDPPQAAQPPDRPGQRRLNRGHLFDRGVEAVAARVHREHGVEGFVESELHPAALEAVTAQPRLVRPGPGALVPDQALAQQQLGQPVPGTHQIPAAVLPGPHQIASGFLGLGRYPHPRDLTDAQQPGQPLRVAAIGLDLVPGRSLDLRRGHHLAAHAGGVSALASPNPVGPAS